MRDVLLIGDLGDVGSYDDVEGLYTAMGALGAAHVSNAMRGTWVPPREGYIVGPDDPTDPNTPPPPPPKGSGWPKAAVPVKEAWASQDGRYVLQRGDTMSGLARTYLGSYPRWKEIWHAQSPDYLASHPSADKIYEGEIINMPKAAQDNARKRGFLGPSKGAKVGLWIAGGVLAVTVVGGGVFAATR